MASYERRTRVEAPFERVWEFHSTVGGLQALTPGWLGLRVDGIRGPDGEALDETASLEAGTLLRLSVRPLGVGPRRTVVSAIVGREVGDGTAVFRDEMRQGPFRRWLHTHRFEAVEGGTVVRDRVEFETPYGPTADAVVRAGMEAAFAYRHWRTRRLLE